MRAVCVKAKRRRPTVRQSGRDCQTLIDAPADLHRRYARRIASAIVCFASRSSLSALVTCATYSWNGRNPKYQKALLYFRALTYATSNPRIVTWKATIPCVLKASLGGLAMERIANVAALFLLLALLSNQVARAADGPVGLHAGLRYASSVICRQSNPPALLNLLFGGNAAGEFRKEQERILVRRSGRQSTRSHRCHSSGGVEPHVHALAIGPI